MRHNVSKWLLIFGFAARTALFAQSTPGQDMRRAGQETKDAAKDTGSAVKKTTKSTAHKVKRGTKRTVNKGAAATERGASKVKEKTSQ
jgi:hypothetical protein